MKPISTVKTLPLLLTSLVVFDTQAGTLDPELAVAVVNKHPGEKIDVIIRCTDPLDPIRISPDNLVPSLKNKTDACETSLSNALKDKSAPPRPLWIINGIAATVPVAQLNGLANRADVDTIYLNKKVTLPPAPVPSGIPGNPPLTYWNLSEIRADDLWALGSYGTGIVVATMDTGVDADHADIGPNWRGGNNSWYDPNGQHATPFDSDGHGTGVMGLIVGGNAGGFDMGVAPDAQWIAVKIFDSSNETTYEKIHLGFQWLLDPDGDLDPSDAPDIVNNSWVLQGTQDQCLGEFNQDIAALKAAGIAVVFSAGNFGPNYDTSMEPANDPASFSVGSINSSLSVPNSSSRGPSACDGNFYPRIAAPGKDVLTAGLTTGGANPFIYAFGTGTSYAAPHVAGAMALLMGAFPDASLAEIEAAIQDGALDIEGIGMDNDSGAGLLDLVEAYNLLNGSAPPQPGDMQFAAATYSLAENGGNLVVSVTRSNGSDGAVSVDYATTDGSASAGSDYTEASGTLNFADGELSRTFSISILDDLVYEGDEDVNLALSNPTGGASLATPANAVLTIAEDDPQPQPGVLQFSVAAYSLAEDGGDLDITVIRSNGSDGAVSVDYATADASATAGSDYAAASGTLSFADGELSRTFSVSLLDDTIYEGDEDVNLALSNPTGGASLATPANAVLTILEDDPLPNDPPAITSSAVTTATEGEAYSYDVAATDPDAGDVLTFSLDASPTGMSIGSGSGLIDWTPSGQAGLHDVTVRVTDAGGLFDTQPFTIDVSEAPPTGVQLYFSTETNTSVPGVSGPYDDADIYLWDGSGFSRVFDASAAGLPGNADVDALVVDGAVYYMSFRRNGGTNVPGIGLVDDEDIVRYEAGAWSLYFDGAAVGLADSNGEDVDGFELLANGDILVSTVGNARVSGLGGTHRDEDLLRCQPAASPVSNCSWSRYFDGSDVALNNSGGEDIDGVSVSPDGSIRLSTLGAFNVAGLSGNDEDVFVCNSPTSGASTACASFGMFFAGGAEGVAGDLDAIDLP